MQIILIIDYKKTHEITSAPIEEILTSERVYKFFVDYLKYDSKDLGDLFMVITRIIWKNLIFN